MRRSISIIIPVFNGETYLKQCLDSIVHQDLKNIEIIIVNDGSTDDSRKIISKYERDKRIIVIDQDNHGRMQARLAGLKIAKGEFITFVDCDDYIDIAMYDNMYKIALRKNADIVSCGFTNIDKEGNILDTQIFSDNFNISRSERILAESPPSLCNSIFHNFLLKKEDIVYQELSRGEDLAVVPCLFYYAYNTVMLEECYYHYRNVNIESRYLKKTRRNKETLAYPVSLLKDLIHIEELFVAGKVLAEFFLEKETKAVDLIPYSLKFPDFFNRYNFKYTKEFLTEKNLGEWYITELLRFIVDYPKYYEGLRNYVKPENKIVVKVFEKVFKVKTHKKLGIDLLSLIDNEKKQKNICYKFFKAMARSLRFEIFRRIRRKIFRH